MPEKQLNHFIPRFMLNYWARDHAQGRYGVDVYDIKRSGYFFSDGRGKKAYSFAIVKNAYVPVIGAQRRVNLEDWFSGLERTLSKAIRQFSEGEITMFSDPKEYAKFLMAVLSFKYRIQAFVAHATDYLTTHTVIKEFHDPEKPLELIVLENIVNATRDDLATYGSCDVEIYHAAEDSFIISDSPYIINTFDGWDALILSNKLMLMLRKNNLITPRFKFTPASTEQVRLVNKRIARQAHYWIVAESEDLLKVYQEEADQVTDLQIQYVPPINLPVGYYFK